MWIPVGTIAFVAKTRAAIKAIYGLYSKQVKEAIEGSLHYSGISLLD